MASLQPEKLLALFFIAAAGLAYLLSSPDPVRVTAAPSFQTSPLPDVRLSTKSVDKAVAAVGDILTYTVVINKQGGPNRQQTILIDRFEPEILFTGNLTYTGVASFLWYSPTDHAVAWGAILPDGPVVTTLTWRMAITGLPPDGVLVNTAWIFSDQQLVTPEAATVIESVTFSSLPTPTETPSPPHTPSPSPTPAPTETAIPTNTITSTPTPASTNPLPTLAAMSSLTSQMIPTLATTVTWPAYLPQTGASR